MTRRQNTVLTSSILSQILKYWCQRNHKYWWQRKHKYWWQTNHKYWWQQNHKYWWQTNHKYWWQTNHEYWWQGNHKYWWQTFLNALCLVLKTSGCLPFLNALSLELKTSGCLPFWMHWPWCWKHPDVYLFECIELGVENIRMFTFLNALSLVLNTSGSLAAVWKGNWGLRALLKSPPAIFVLVFN